MLKSAVPQDKLQEFAKKNIVFINPLSEMRKHPLKEKLYWENDDHLSELGHRVIFEMLEKEILN